MSELWHVTALDAEQHEVYFAALSVGNDDVTTPGAAAALIVAMDRLLVEGYDPRQVSTWKVVRDDKPKPCHI